MSAFLKTEYKKGFLLNEEGLIKIHDLVRKRMINENAEAELKFKVYRTDEMLLEYKSPSEVALEENAPRNSVKRVELHCDGSLGTLRLTFDASEPIDLHLMSENRDLAYLIFSDVKEYLAAEVLKFRSFSFDSIISSRMMLPLIAASIPLFMIFAIDNKPDLTELDQALKTIDLAEKLNYLIGAQKKRQELGELKFIMGAAFTLMLTPFFIGSLLDKAFPRNIFYWGKAASSYDKLLSVREKLLWGVVIAFAIGIASTVAVDFFKPH